MTMVRGMVVPMAGGGSEPPVPQPPQITLQPLDQSVFVGEVATFESNATDYLSVQWWVSSNNGSTWQVVATGGNQPTVIITTNENHNGRIYKAIYTNAAGETETLAALLTVSEIPDFNQNDFKSGDFA